MNVGLGVALLLIMSVAPVVHADDSGICGELATEKAQVAADEQTHQSQLAAIEELKKEVESQTHSVDASKTVGISASVFMTAVGALGAAYYYASNGQVVTMGRGGTMGSSRFNWESVAMMLGGVAVDTASGYWIHIEQKNLFRLQGALAAANATARTLSQKIQQNQEYVEKMSQIAGCNL